MPFEKHIENFVFSLNFRYWKNGIFFILLKSLFVLFYSCHQNSTLVYKNNHFNTFKNNQKLKKVKINNFHKVIFVTKWRVGHGSGGFNVFSNRKFFPKFSFSPTNLATSVLCSIETSPNTFFVEQNHFRFRLRISVGLLFYLFSFLLSIGFLLGGQNTFSRPFWAKTVDSVILFNDFCYCPGTEVRRDKVGAQTNSIKVWPRIEEAW